MLSPGDEYYSYSFRGRGGGKGIYKISRQIIGIRHSSSSSLQTARYGSKAKEASESEIETMQWGSCLEERFLPAFLSLRKILHSVSTSGLEI
jgi:hypothetical protein